MDKWQTYLEKLGIQVKDTDGSLRSFESILSDIANALATNRQVLYRRERLVEGDLYETFEGDVEHVQQLIKALGNNYLDLDTGMMYLEDNDEE